jgi:hypothetical protein
LGDFSSVVIEEVEGNWRWCDGVVRPPPQPWVADGRWSEPKGEERCEEDEKGENRCGERSGLGLQEKMVRLRLCLFVLLLLRFKKNSWWLVE